MAQVTAAAVSMKRDMEPDTPVGCGGGDHSSDDDGSSTMDVKPQIGNHGGNGQGERGRGKGPQGGGSASDAASKKTKGRVKIKMEFIDNKLRRYTTFSKRKTGIMKKAYELSTLTGTQVMLLVASETGHVYTFATRKLQPMITSDAGKALIQTCLNSPDPAPGQSANNININNGDQRMSATGFEETELTYNVAEDEQQKIDLQGDDGDDEDEDDEPDEEEEEVQIREERLDEGEEEEEEEEEEQEIPEFVAREAAVRTASMQQQRQKPRLEAIVARTAAKQNARKAQPRPSPSSSSSSLQIMPIVRPSPSAATVPAMPGLQPRPTPVTTLAPSVVAQLMASGHFVREDGTLVRFATPASSSASTSEVVVSLTTPAAPSTSSSSSGTPPGEYHKATRKRRRK